MDGLRVPNGPDSDSGAVIHVVKLIGGVGEDAAQLLPRPLSGDGRGRGGLTS
jgi:hypothetical protein